LRWDSARTAKASYVLLDAVAAAAAAAVAAQACHY
jgi:hypothetical protein